LSEDEKFNIGIRIKHVNVSGLQGIVEKLDQIKKAYIRIEVDDLD